MTDKPSARLLVVDDEPSQVMALCATLEDHGYLITGFTSAKEALSALHTQEFDLILTDLMMPEMDGIAFLQEAQQIDRNLVGIMMTGHGAIETAVNAMKAGALDYVLKPFKLTTVLPTLERALSVRRLRMENIQLREAVVLYEASMAIAFARDAAGILQVLAEGAFQQSEGGEVSILLPTEDDSGFSVVEARGTRSTALLGCRIPRGESFAEWVGKYRDSIIAGGNGDPTITDEHPLHEFTNGVSLPMLAGRELIGVLNFASSHTRRPVSLGQIKTLKALVNAAASALANVQLLERLEQRVAERTEQLQSKNKLIEEELRMARDLQVAMLPSHFPCLPRGVSPAQSAVRFFSVYRPAGSISGDFFDVIPITDSSVGIFIGDVMGHDVRAALVTAMMRALVHELTASHADPGALLSEVNRQLSSMLKQADPIMFATASYLVVDPEHSQVHYANAGHPVPIHLRRSIGEAAPLCRKGDSGPALGLFDHAVYKTHSAPLAAGDCIVLFTDGLFEVEAADEEIYSQERLHACISRKLELPAEQIVDNVFSDIRAFSGQSGFTDDICVVAVEVARVTPTNIVPHSD